MTSDLEALIRTVIACPDDDTPRLVVADWFEEHGEGDRAEFIRVQIELARMSNRPKVGWRFLADGTSVEAESRAVRDENPREEKLRRRERELLKKSYAKWFNIPGPWMPHGQSPAGHASDHPTVYLSSADNWHQSSAQVRRGWVDTVSCTIADWMAHGKSILASHPIRPHEQLITDLIPVIEDVDIVRRLDARFGWRWFRPRSGSDNTTPHQNVPSQIHDYFDHKRLRGGWFLYESEYEARMDLARALFGHATSGTDLPHERFEPQSISGRGA